MKSFIDVVIPTYNCGRYIREAIDSVILQGGIVNTIYVIDDGSTDDTKEVIKSLEKTTKKIKYIYKENGGPSSARNLGLKVCNSKYVALLDADDIWEANKLSLQLARFRNNKYAKLGVVYVDYIDIDERGVQMANATSYHPSKPAIGNIRKRLLDGNIVAASDSGVMIKKECFDELGYFDENMMFGEDWDMWLRISQKYEFDYIEKSLVKIRRRKGSIQTNSKRAILDLIYFYHKLLSNDVTLSAESLDGLRRMIISSVIFNPFNLLFNFRMIMRTDDSLRRKLWPNYNMVIYTSVWVIYSKANSIKLSLRSKWL